MKKMISKICLFLFIALIAVSCEDFPVDEDGLLITTRAECYVSNFDLYNTDHQTIKLGNAYVDTTAQVAIMYVKFGTPINNVWPRISLCAVSYTHLDVYKRQEYSRGVKRYRK